ncbi:MAG: thiamine ABC transporter substrate-binding protein [Candidatus Thorarchaeota archaeon]
MTEYPRRRDPKRLIIAVVVIVSVIVAAFAFITWPRPKMYVYTYDSFLLWGDESKTIDETAFGPFERQYGVDVEIVRLNTDANGIVSRLVAEAGNPVADVVIGIDNLLILQEQARSVLEPYNSTNIGLVNKTLVQILDPDQYLTPFDFGVVTIIYSSNTLNTTVMPSLNNLTFSELAKPDVASMLVTENPHLSSPGLAFLLSEIAVYHGILGTDWRSWWSDVKGHIDVQEGWSEAWSKWDSDPTRHMMVSYGTDPAYSAYYSTESKPTVGVAPLHYNAKDYAWLQVEGMGLVKNGPNPELAKAFIDYCLTETVQSHIALNQWMYPANQNVELPTAFDFAVHPDDINPLNEFLPATLIQANLTSWLDEYDLVMTT